MTHAAGKVFPIQLDLPAPPRELSKNGRAHWAQKARLFREYKDHAAWMLVDRYGIGDEQGTSEPVVMDLVWCGPRRYWPDSDNAVERVACYRDALQAAGLIVNDSQVSIGTVTFGTGSRAARCFVTFRLAGQRAGDVEAT